MSRTNRETNLGVRIGDTIIHCNDQFTIVDIRRAEDIEGMKLVIICTDLGQAYKMEQDRVTQNQVIEKVTELLAKLTGGLGDMGKG